MHRPTVVAVGSANPVKIAAVSAIVRHAAPHVVVRSASVASGVPDQPWGDAETVRGARNRAIAARTAFDADIGVGLEGGVVDEGGGAIRTCAWAAVALRDGRVFVGGSLAMPLPERVARLIREGVELGHAIDRVTAQQDTKHGAGAVGVLTGGLIDRQRAYETLVAYALAPLLAPEFWETTEHHAGDSRPHMVDG